MRLNSRFCLYSVAAVLTCVIDQGIKRAIRKLPEDAVFFSIPGLLELTHSTNKGAAFSLFSGHTGVLAILSIALLVFLAIMLMKNMHLTEIARWVLAVLIGAGTGNLIDRLIYGGVTDYIRLIFIRFPIFNFADICITCSVLILSVYIMSGKLDKVPEESMDGTND